MYEPPVPITIVLVPLQLIKEKTIKNKKEEIFNKTKVYKTTTKKFQSHLYCIMLNKIGLSMSRLFFVFIFIYVKVHNWAYMVGIAKTIYIQRIRKQSNLFIT